MQETAHRFASKFTRAFNKYNTIVGGEHWTTKKRREEDDVFLHFLNSLEHRGLLLPKKPLPSISDIFEILAFDLQRFFQRSIYLSSIALFASSTFFLRSLTIFRWFRKKIRKKKKRRRTVQTHYDVQKRTKELSLIL